DEQGRSNLPVRMAAGREVADPQLRGRQRVAPGQFGPCSTPRTALQLGQRALRQRGRTALIGKCDRSALLRARLAAPAQTGQLTAEIGDGVGELEPRTRVLEYGHSLLKQRQSLLLFAGRRRQAQRQSEPSPRSDPTSHRELLATESGGPRLVSERGK